MCRLCGVDRKLYNPPKFESSPYRIKNNRKVRTVYRGVSEQIKANGDIVYYCTVTRNSNTYYKTTDNLNDAIIFVDGFGLSRNNQEKTKEFSEAVKDYTGEYPCTTCMKGGGISRISPDNTIDDLIIRKLFRLATRKKARETRNAHARIVSFFSSYITSMSTNNITTVENNSTGSIIYRLVIVNTKHGINRSFNSLSDAIFTRNKILDTIAKEKPKKGNIIKTKIEDNIHSVFNDVTLNKSFGVKICIGGKGTSRCFSSYSKAKHHKEIFLKKQKRMIETKKKETIDNPIIKTLVFENITRVYNQKTHMIYFSVRIIVDKKSKMFQFSNFDDAKTFVCNYHRKNNKGLFGVSKREYGRYASRIMVGGVTHGLGVFDTEEEAGKAYDKYIADNNIKKVSNGLLD